MFQRTSTKLVLALAIGVIVGLFLSLVTHDVTLAAETPTYDVIELQPQYDAGAATNNLNDMAKKGWQFDGAAGNYLIFKK